jgi:MFS superfamily sulfate permease-like transporter
MLKNQRALPKTGFEGLTENWRFDLISGFLVFLIALPLCIGISIASGFPPMSGIITAVIGGLVVSRISGSYVTINGPAAGLIVVILTAVQNLGGGDTMAGFRFTLAAIVVASFFQVIMGLLKAGKLNAYFPASVVHGMLAAIGVIIMAKQTHVLLGVKPQSKEIIDTILEIPHSIATMNPAIALIGVSGILILILWTQIKNGFLKKIPAPLVVVTVGIALGRYFGLETEHTYSLGSLAGLFPNPEYPVGPKYLVTVSEHIMSSFYAPDFGKFWTSEFLAAVVSICLVGSLETLLSATAVDKLDPYKRESNLNRDLTAVGIGNLLAGAIGGLPMIAEIVRSSANVNNGARTGWANFFHGAFLALFVLFVPGLIHMIPLSSLAALLVFTGFRLASPKEFAKTMKIGNEQLFIFTSTILAVLATDLLIGVLAGIVIKIVIHLIRGVPLGNLVRINFTIKETEQGEFTVRIEGSAIFANFVGLKSALADIPLGQAITFDVTDASYIDHTVMEFIEQFQHDYIDRGGKCIVNGLEDLVGYSDHPLAARKRS